LIPVNRTPKGGGGDKREKAWGGKNQKGGSKIRKALSGEEPRTKLKMAQGRQKGGAKETGREFTGPLKKFAP